ncbi:MAG: hypothetical protein ABW019_11765 [Chitinophagaceae bacterium]
MFVIAARHALLVLSFFALLIALIYLLAGNVLWSKYLTWFHVIVTLVVLVVFSWAMIRDDKPDPEGITWTDRHKQQATVLFFTIVFLAGKAAFVVNLAGGIVKHLLGRKGKA